MYPIMKRRSVCSLALTSLLLLGCASAPEKVPAEVSMRMKRVGVVSIIGHELVRSYIGATVFGNEFHRHDVAEWQLDSVYEKQLASAASGVAGVTVLIDSVDRAPVAKADTAGDTANWASISVALQQQCSVKKLDGILAVARSTDRGIGVRVSRQYSVRDLGIWAEVALYDCKNSTIVARQ